MPAAFFREKNLAATPTALTLKAVGVFYRLTLWVASYGNKEYAPLLSGLFPCIGW